jgi:SOS-response transcriptional repressor LexA
MANTVRPTKKQRELLNFIEQFIGEHGYSPSYREVMTGLNYTSVATVALHINNLIKRGHLRKRDHSARSLEVTEPSDDTTAKITSNTVRPGEEKWLVEKIEHFFAEAESVGEVTQEHIDQLYVLVGTLRVLSLEGAAQSFMPRLTALKQKLTS